MASRDWILSHQRCVRLVRAAVVASVALAASAFVALAARADEPPAPAQAKQEPVRFLRVVRDGDEPKALEVAVVHCVPKNPAERSPTVDLITAVHVAEPSFYKELNKRFAGYDAVLYELVAPEGTRVRPGEAKSDNPVSMVQHGLTDLLDLQFQLDGIDYQGKNMVHADMSPEQFAESMKTRDESFLEIFTRTLGYSLARQQQAAAGEARLMTSLFEGDRVIALRRYMAEQFEEMPAMVRAIEGAKGTTLVSQRNKRALEVLRKQVTDGKRRVAIFYGAAHMSDMLQRLQKDFSLVPKKTEWLPAWNLSSR